MTRDELTGHVLAAAFAVGIGGAIFLGMAAIRDDIYRPPPMEFRYGDVGGTR